MNQPQFILFPPKGIRIFPICSVTNSSWTCLLGLCAILGHFLIGRNLLTHQQLLILLEHQSDAKSWVNLAPKMLFGSFYSQCWFGLHAPLLPSNSLYVSSRLVQVLNCGVFHSFLKDPTRPLLPLLPRDDLTSYFPEKMTSWEVIWGELPKSFSPKLLSISTQKNSDVFCKPQILYGMNGSVHFLKVSQTPNWNLVLLRTAPSSKPLFQIPFF